MINSIAAVFLMVKIMGFFSQINTLLYFKPCWYEPERNNLSIGSRFVF